MLLPSLASSSQASDREGRDARSTSQIGNRTDATPRGDRSTWFRRKDYPSEAKRNEQRGRVSITLQIDRKGVPRNCVVTGSSGWPFLDQATCNLALDRARFHPARVAGNAVKGAYSLTTNWTLFQR
jgi:protein TonB